MSDEEELDEMNEKEKEMYYKLRQRFDKKLKKKYGLVYDSLSTMDYFYFSITYVGKDVKLYIRQYYDDGEIRAFLNFKGEDFNFHIIPNDERLFKLLDAIILKKQKEKILSW